MGVLALMYHRTPREAGHPLDVPMPLFQAQIQALQAADVRFTSFGQALNQRWYGGETVVSLTFDDGHGSNLEAMDFLDDFGIPSTSFFVSDYVRRGQNGFMGATMFKEASALCEVGAHGATHTDLTSLRPEALEEELVASKAFLELLSGTQVTTMSAPGGKIDGRVVCAALKLGFEVVADFRGFAQHNAKPPNTSHLHAEWPISRVCALSRTRRTDALAAQKAPANGHVDGGTSGRWRITRGAQTHIQGRWVSARLGWLSARLGWLTDRRKSDRVEAFKVELLLSHGPIATLGLSQEQVQGSLDRRDLP